MSYVRHFTRPARIVASFGIRRGVTAYSHYVRDHILRSTRGSAKQLNLRGLNHPVWLRPGTSDWLVMEQTFIAQEYDFSEWEEHGNLVQRCYRGCLERSRKPVIIDCGANIGLSSVWFAERFPDAIVYAVEPEPDNYSILVRNALSYPNLVPVNAAISDREGRVSIVNPGDEPWAWQTMEAEDGGFATVTVPELLEREADSLPLLVKVNIEGAEATLFRSNLEWVEQTALIIIELHDWLIPWRGIGHVVLSGLTRHVREYLPRGKLLFSFSHACKPDEANDIGIRSAGVVA